MGLFSLLERINDFVWGNIALLLVVILGGYFAWTSRLFPIRKFGAIFASFVRFFSPEPNSSLRGIHPLKAFFAAIGGCIGIGNIVAICTAVQLGGPGALFWVWVGGFAGMLIQYAEVYLGMRYRVKNSEGSFDGGPMYFLPAAYKVRWIAIPVCLLLCFYGVEIFMFNVMVDSISVNWQMDEIWVAAILLIATLAVALGGIKRVGEVCSALIPLFIVLYLAMAFWVLFVNRAEIPSVLLSIVQGAFSPQAAAGGFAGSSVMLTISMGLSRGAYSGDLGAGYASVIHAESQTDKIQRQSSLTIIAILLDTFLICTMSILVVLATGHWNSGIDATLMIQEALGLHFPHMYIFMPIFLFLLGYTTILAYFVVGVKCAKFLSPKWGSRLYYAYAIVALPTFALFESAHTFLLMSLCGACLLILNLTGIFILRKEVYFGLDE